MTDSLNYPRWGVAGALTDIVGYTQTAVNTTAMNLLLGASQEVTWTAANLITLSPGAPPELLVDANGRLYIPDQAVSGRWSPSVVVDCSLGGNFQVTLATYDSTGAVVGSVATTDYPATRGGVLIAGTGAPFAAFRPIGHVQSSGDLIIRCTIKALVAANVTRVQLGMTKL